MPLQLEAREREGAGGHSEAESWHTRADQQRDAILSVDEQLELRQARAAWRAWGLIAVLVRRPRSGSITQSAM